VQKTIAWCLCAMSVVLTASVWWGYAHLTDLVQRQLRGITGDDLTIGKVSARWNRVELDQVRLVRREGSAFPQWLAVERLVLRPRLVSLFSGRMELGEISLDKPYLLLEIAADGSLVNPLRSRPAPSGPAKPGQSMPVSISGLNITGGTIDLIDRHVVRQGGIGFNNPRERLHLLSFNRIDLNMGPFDVPLTDRTAPLQLTLQMQGGGSIALNGKLSPQSLESKLQLDVKDLDIPSLRPYFLKKGDLDVVAGKLSVQSAIAIEKRQLKAPGEVVLKGLSFDQSGAKGFWMGLSAKALKGMMSDNKGDLKMKFSVNGSLDNPKFAVRQSFVELLAAGLSSKLGIASASSIGKGLFDAGGSGVKGLLKVFGR
jgi:hypothetical protein